jgi:hypothetical protein
MTFVALSIPDWPTGAAANDLLAQLLAVAPRAAVSPAEHLAWLDARSLQPAALATSARAALGSSGIAVQGAAAAQVPVVAAVAARRGDAQGWIDIAPGAERSYLAPLPLTVLGGEGAVHHLLFGIGVTRCGELAPLSRESVEVRFGRDGMTLWRMARADDRRRLFSARPRELPSASLDWTEFSTTDLEQLIFVLHSLLKTVCDQLITAGIGARTLEITLSLENHTTLIERVTAARGTSQRTTWLRLVRRTLEKVDLPDRITGIAVRVDAAGPPTVRQGDFFDLGFASEEAAESAVSHILDLQSDAVIVPQLQAHPLLERRVAWQAHPEGMPARDASAVDLPAALHPQLLPTARAVDVATRERRSFLTPVHYTDNGVRHPLRESLGPRCVSGMPWEAPIAREYHQVVRDDGVVVLLYRDALVDQWYLAGWWD